PLADEGTVVERTRSGSRQDQALKVYGLAATKVLVIDNDAAVLQGMGALLDRWGCETHLFAGLDEVEALIAAAPAFVPDIILADFHLDDGACGLAAVERF